MRNVLLGSRNSSKLIELEYRRAFPRESKICSANNAVDFLERDNEAVTRSSSKERDLPRILAVSGCVQRALHLWRLLAPAAAAAEPGARLPAGIITQ